jgi:hypothetical protein
LLTA